MEAQTTALATEMAPRLFTQGMVILIGLLVVRDMVWKAIGLWKS